MSDIIIPGVTSRIDSAKIIEGLMILEAIPKTRAEERLKTIQTEKSAWLDLNQKLVGARESARSLYSFNNPFSERVANSSDEKVLVATATREAVEETRSILVKRTAAADRFQSDRLAKDFRVPAGDYEFSVGEKKVSLRYSGGSLKDFADALTRKGGDLVRARVIPVTSDTQTLLIEAIPTGSANRLAMGGAAEKLALDAGFLQKTLSRERSLGTSEAGIATWDSGLERGKVRLVEGAIRAEPGASAKLAISPALSAKGLTLEYEVRVSKSGTPSAVAEGPPPGPAAPAAGSITYGGVTIRSLPSEAETPEWTPPPVPPSVDDIRSLFVLDASGREAPLPDPVDDGTWRKVSVALDGLVSGDLAALGIRNRDTSRTVELRGVRVFDPSESGGFKPKNPVDTARDALVEMDGIEIVRSSNTIDDLIPGVTVTLKKASEEEVDLEIDSDREAAKEAIIDLVGNYNRMMAEINILQREDEKILSEITYFTADERSAYKERLGVLGADTTLSNVRSALQRLMMNPYPGASGDPVLLAMMGVSTNATRGSGYDASKLRGYLEIDEKALSKALDTRFQDVRALFGSDTDGDLLVDAGLAYTLDMLLKPYVETGGIVSLKTGTLDARSRDQTRTIETLTAQLERKEAELKREYGSLEGALDRMDALGTSIENFGKSGSGQ